MSESVILKEIQEKLSEIEEKVSAILSIEKKKNILEKMEAEEAIGDWSAKLVRMGRKGRIDALKAKGLI